MDTVIERVDNIIAHFIDGINEGLEETLEDDDPIKQHFIEYGVYGGKIKNKTLKGMIINGYDDNKKETIDGYKIDKDLSGDRVQVYYNPSLNHAVINHRGTKGFKDIITDINMTLFNNKSSKRFEHSKDITNKAKEKYLEAQFSHIGHSLGAELAHQANKDNDEMIKYNGVVLPYDFFRKQNKKEHRIRTEIDPISLLQPLQPFNISSNNITIPSEAYNPLEEHRATTLERLDPEQEIGGELKTKRSKRLLRKKII